MMTDWNDRSERLQELTFVMQGCQPQLLVLYYRRNVMLANHYDQRAGREVSGMSRSRPKPVAAMDSRIVKGRWKSRKV